MSALSRRDFMASGASALALAGCQSGGSFGFRSEPGFIWAYLVHFGCNCWKDVPPERVPRHGKKPMDWLLTRCQYDHVRFDEDAWKDISARLAKAGVNMIVIDLAEFVRYESHPELAVEGSWDVGRLCAEIARLRGMGFEVIPKLNFSTSHDSWLKEYHRMVSTPAYYRVCEDLVREVIGMFDRPRLFHLGFDEETAGQQWDCEHVVVRQGDLWWHDLNWFVSVVEKSGCRPWVWSDAYWHHPEEFLRRMSREVLQSNWYYGAEFDPAKVSEDRRIRLRAYEDFERAGFDQIPTGSNYSCDTNFEGSVALCDKVISPAHLKGYLMAPWARPLGNDKADAAQRAAVEQMASTILLHRGR